MLRARERKALKLFSAARDCEYTKRRACRICAVRMSVGVGDDESDVGAASRTGAAGSGAGSGVVVLGRLGAGVSVGKSS